MMMYYLNMLMKRKDLANKEPIYSDYSYGEENYTYYKHCRSSQTPPALTSSPAIANTAGYCKHHLRELSINE